jgi:hypothetical protein
MYFLLRSLIVCYNIADACCSKFRFTLNIWEGGGGTKRLSLLFLCCDTVNSSDYITWNYVVVNE